MNRSYDLHAWKLFLRVAETGNLSVVAAELGMEISTLSRAISTLEKSIGHNLFEPNSRPKRLTRIGAIATEKLRETIAMHEEFEKLVQKGAAFVDIGDDKDAFIGIITRGAIIKYCHQILFPED